jgi:hypothetical protein
VILSGREAIRIYRSPPLITRNCRRRSGVVVTGAIGCVASPASRRSPIVQTRSAMPSAIAGVLRNASMYEAEIVVSDIQADR